MTATLDDIAAEIGMTRGAVYWHFRNKEDVLSQLCQEQYTRFTLEIEEELKKKLSAFKKLKRIVEINFHALYDNEDFCNFIELTWFKTESTHFNKLLKDKEKITEHFNETITKVLTQCRKTGEVKKSINPMITALSITTLLNGIFRGYFLMPDKMRNKKVAVSILDDYMQSLTLKPSGYETKRI